MTVNSNSSIDLFGDFRWPVCTSGYRWISGYNFSPLLNSTRDNLLSLEYGTFLVPINEADYQWGQPQIIAITKGGRLVGNKDDTFLTGFANIKIGDSPAAMESAFLSYAHKFGRLIEFGPVNYLVEFPRDRKLELLSNDETVFQALHRVDGSLPLIKFNPQENLALWCNEFFDLRWAIKLEEASESELRTLIYKEVHAGQEYLTCYVSEDEAIARNNRLRFIKAKEKCNQPFWRRQPTREEAILSTHFGLNKPAFHRRILKQEMMNGADAFAAFEAKKMKAVARIFLQGIINEKLEQQNIQPKMRFLRDEAGELYQTEAPRTLLSAIWLQFGQWVSKTRNLRRCEICKQFQDITGRHNNWKRHPQCQGARGTKEQRKKRAAEVLYLLQSGKNIEQLSAELNMSLREVKAKIRKAERDIQDTNIKE